MYKIVTEMKGWLDVVTMCFRSNVPDFIAYHSKDEQSGAKMLIAYAAREM